jgi:hypothetical protein
MLRVAWTRCAVSVGSHAWSVGQDLVSIDPWCGYDESLLVSSPIRLCLHFHLGARQKQSLPGSDMLTFCTEKDRFRVL